MRTARALVFQTVEDAAVPAEPPGCPWPDANVLLGGRMRRLDGGGGLGIAQACARIGAALEPGAEVPFYAEFRFDSGDLYRAAGAAHVLSNDIPAAGIVLAGCALRIVDGPEGFVGGVVTSASVFNPAGRPEAGTGSTWTLHAYFQ
jgi:hypothetical protein